MDDYNDVGYEGFSESLTPNPIMCFVDFILNPRDPEKSVNITAFPNFTFQSFTHSYSDKNNIGAGDFSISVFDASWTEIEYYLFQKQVIEREVLFQYGYVGGAQSPRYRGQISAVEAQLEHSGMTLTLSGKGISSIASWVQRYLSFSNKPIHQIVRELIQIEGFQAGLIVPTRKVGHPNNPSQHRTYQMLGQTFFQFTKLLIKDSVSETGLSKYEIRIDNSYNPPLVHFVPSEYFGKNVGVDAGINSLNEEKGKSTFYRSYNFERSERSEVISWKPEIELTKIFAKGIGGGSGGVIQTVTIDTKTKEVKSHVTDPTKTPKASVPKAPNPHKQKSTVTTMRPKTVDDKVKKPEIGRSLILPSDSSQNILTRQQAVLEAARAPFITGELEILGDPQFPSYSRVQLVVLTPLNLEHYTSGMYIVQNVSHSISDTFTTTLTMMSGSVQNSSVPIPETPYK